MFAALEIDVTVLDKRKRPLEFADEEIVKELMDQMRNCEVTFCLGETVERLEIFGGTPRQVVIPFIGEHFDRLYDLASLTSPPLKTGQTTPVPSGGAALVELKLEVTGRYLLVDHAPSRLEKGMLGILDVEGTAHRELFNESGTNASPAR